MSSVSATSRRQRSHLYAAEPLEPRRLLAVVTVTTALDEADGNVSGIDALSASPGGAGISLREAILAANNTPGPDAVHFNIPGAGVHVLNVAAALPRVNERLVIDGYSEPGSNENTRGIGSDAFLTVHLRGGDMAASGLDLRARSTVRGLAITGFACGINIAANGIRIEGNWIGVTPAGTREGNSDGVYASGHDVHIGGGSPSTRNVISGNFIGVSISGSDITIRNNYIGTTPDGAGPLGNNTGVVFDGRTSTIGGQGDRRNVISGNTAGGVRIISSVGVVLAGNYIGPGAEREPIGNDFAGVRVVASHFVKIGLADVDRRNTIAHNHGRGVVVEASDRVTIRFNRIHDNVAPPGGGKQLGIDLLGNDAPDGVTQNDPADGDAGANDLQNFPILVSAVTELGASAQPQTIVTGALNSIPLQQFVIDFYRVESVDPSGHGEGDLHIGSITVNTDENGIAEFSAPLPATSARHISATATHDATGNTSEFSISVAVSSPGPRCTVTKTTDTFPVPQEGEFRYCIDRSQFPVVIPGTIIDFNIEGAGPHFITPLQPYLYFRPPVFFPTGPERILIDGNSQPGQIYIDGASIGDAIVFHLNGGSALVGLNIVRFPSGAIATDRAGNLIHDVTVGVGHLGQPLGAIFSQASGYGIGIFGDDTTVSDSLIYAGQGKPGVYASASAITLSNNRIGVNRGGVVLPDNGPGVSAFETFESNISGNTIHSGTSPAVRLDDSFVIKVTENSLFGGIELLNGSNDGPTAPVMTSALSGNTIDAFVGTLTAAPNTPYRIEFFASSGPGQGQRVVGTVTRSTDAAGRLDIIETFPRQVAAGEFITATATGPDGNTSAFSNAVAAEDRTGPVIVFGSAANTDTVSVPFNEPLSPASLAPGNFSIQLTPAGPSRSPADVFFVPESNTAFLSFTPPLADGDHTFTIAPTVADVSGNSLGSPVTLRFAIVGPAGTLNLNNSGPFDSVYAGENARLNLAAGLSSAFDAKSLDLELTATFDIADNDLIVTAGPQDVAALVSSARNSGAAGLWSGPGITSSIAKSDPFMGLATSAIGDRVLIRLAPLGDINGDDKVNALDAFSIDRGRALRLDGYENGDLDYSGGTPDADDLMIYDRGFLHEHAAPPGGPPPGPQSALPPRPATAAQQDQDDQAPIWQSADPSPLA